MKIFRTLLAASVLAGTALVSASAVAQNITYTGSDSQAGYDINYLITTNGALGTLSLDDIVSSTITITPGTNPKFTLLPSTATGTLYFSHTDADGNVDGPNPVIASATNLSFDYSNGGGLNFGTDLLVYALAARDISDNDAVVYEHNGLATREIDSPNDTNYRLAAGTYTEVKPDLTLPQPLVQSFATAIGATPALPEPASWALMILGIGTIGVVMRRRVRAEEVTFDMGAKRITDADVPA